jgi:hypothetical protein
MSHALELAEAYSKRIKALEGALRWFVDYHEDPAQPVVTFEEYMARARAALAEQPHAAGNGDKA